MNEPVSETRMSACQPLDLTVQGRLVRTAPPAVPQARAGPAQNAADSPLRNPVPLVQVIGGGPLLIRGHHFFFNEPQQS
jgi:hypothetical protein